MADRNTKIKKHQIGADSIEPSDLDASNSPVSGQVPTLGSNGKFEWKDKENTVVDNFTIINDSGILKLADRIENNILILAFLRAVDQGKIKYDMQDGFIDEYEDESGIDTVNSINQLYDSTYDYYSPSSSSSSDQLTGGTVTANAYYTTYIPSKACDNTVGTQWLCYDTPFPHWWKYDFGSGVSKTITTLKITAVNNGNYVLAPGTFKLQGSNNDSDWVDINSWTSEIFSQGETKTYNFSNNTAYRYYRLYITDNSNDSTNSTMIEEIEMMENGQSNNMTIISNGVTVETEPSKVRAVIFEEDVDAITINTDLKVYISIDNVNWDEITLADEGNYETSKRILSGIVDVSARTGTSLKYKLVTSNNKSLKIHGIGITWL